MTVYPTKCKICWKNDCYNANPTNMWLGTTRPCVMLKVWIWCWHDIRPLSDIINSNWVISMWDEWRHLEKLIVRGADWTILEPNK